MPKSKKEWVKQLVNQPYESRKIITFVDGKNLNIDTKEKEESYRYIERKPSESEDRGKKYIDLVGLHEFMLDESPKSFLRAHAFNLPSDADESLIEEENTWEEGTPLIPIPLSWKKHLHLPTGHPRKETLYAGHPHARRNYLPVDRFHYSVFEHKFTEVMRVLMHLGATKIEVKHEKGWGKEIAGEVSSDAAYLSGEGTAEAERSSQSEALYYAELDGHEEPSLPDNLSWYHHEPTWQNFVEGRMEFGMREFSLKIRYNDDFGIDADLAAQVLEMGFSLGGSFEEYQETVWEIEGEFLS
ncbi:hypothetical protein [Salinibacter sp.]|uniref:hypothetical protein n=1 Tax=Salinibacter sp. TaxID=2065818 RepID=UPI0021E7D6FB|nr:hypothetical protein [Salinibacter sp.]